MKYRLPGLVAAAALPLTGILTTVSAASAASGSVVINEIMYNPASDVDDEEFLEIHNPGDTAVSLSGMSFTDGISGTFGDLTLEPGAYAIISPSIATSELIYGVTPIMEYGGGIKNSGETITLTGPDGVSIVDSVTYDDGDGWPVRRGPRHA